MLKRIGVLVMSLAVLGLLGGGGVAQFKAPTLDGRIADGEYANRYLAEAIGMELHWTIEGDFIYIALQAPAPGWVAVGWDPSGPIKEGTDIVIGYVREGNLYLQDYFANTSVSHASDVSLGGRDDLLESSGSEDENFTTIEFRRKLDTQDKFDRPLTSGAHTVLLAYSPNDDFVTYHGEKRTESSSISLWGAHKKRGSSPGRALSAPISFCRLGCGRYSQGL